MSLLLLLVGLLGACRQTPKEEYYVKHLEFPEGLTVDQKAAMAAHLIPTAQQLAWQKDELTAFLHFGINTFTGREWGDGSEDPALFNPTELDANQWVKTLRDAGFKMVIITAKHHDGFCLWPTRTTEHSVKSSPWKEGRGDVVRELREACDRYGMKFGVYLSPWDRNAACYGDSPTYNRMFIEQLTELLTDYGEVHEVWFDGANGEGPNGKKQVYDWPAFYEVIRRLQPHAVTAIMGDDVRWVGNERGLGRQTEWSATVLMPEGYERALQNNERIGVSATAKDLGSREVLEKASEIFWYPSEVDVSIRLGWFYHKEQDEQVKSLKQLTDIYFQSVGYNSVLLLNIPPDRRGLIHEADCRRLAEFADYIARTFADNRVKSGDKLWLAEAGNVREYALKPDSRVNLLVLQEDIATGQRVEGVTVEAQTADGWIPLCKATTVGHKRILRFPDVEASALRVKIDSTRATARICNVGAYWAETLTDDARQVVWNDFPRAQWKIASRQPLTIDLGQTAVLAAFTYAPLYGEARPDMAYKYKVQVSRDGVEWQTVIADGEFSNIMHNPQPQTVTFDSVVVARYFRIEASSPDAAVSRIAPEEIGLKRAKKE